MTTSTGNIWNLNVFPKFMLHFSFHNVTRPVGCGMVGTCTITYATYCFVIKCDNSPREKKWLKINIVPPWTLRLRQMKNSIIFACVVITILPELKPETLCTTFAIDNKFNYVFNMTFNNVLFFYYNTESFCRFYFMLLNVIIFAIRNYV